MIKGSNSLTKVLVTILPMFFFFQIQDFDLLLGYLYITVHTFYQLPICVKIYFNWLFCFEILIIGSFAQTEHLELDKYGIIFGYGFEGIFNF